MNLIYVRKNYVLHSKDLRLYTDLGLKADKINKILEFKQEAFIVPYIEMCTFARKNSISTSFQVLQAPESWSNYTTSDEYKG